jgi:hypothetical protein
LISRENYYPLHHIHHSIDETAGIRNIEENEPSRVEKDALNDTEAAQFFGLSLKAEAAADP